MASTFTLRCSPGPLGETGNRNTGESFAAPDPTHSFVRFSLHAHSAGGNVQRARNYVAHFGAVWPDAWVLSNDCDVGIRNHKSFALDTLDGELQHFHRIAPLVGGISVGKELADISLACRAE